MTREDVVSRPAPGREGGRSLALDAFRGLAVAAMILVNTPGAARHPLASLRHAPGNGCTPADLIFPAFLFIVGVAIWLSVGTAVARGVPGRTLSAKIVRRAILIFVLGLLLNAFPDFEWRDLRIPGVLQRIALCYLLAASVVVLAGVRGIVLTAACLLIGQELLLAGAAGQPPDLNLGAALDRLVLDRHLLHETWDPEGLLGTLGATATTLGGVVAGRYWSRSERSTRRATVVLGSGLLCVLLGGALSPWIPLNKTLWSASFAVFTLGTSLVALALCSWLVEVRGADWWVTPLLVFGTNPLVAYVLAVLCDKALRTLTLETAGGATVTLQMLVYTALFARWMPAPYASLAYSLAYVAVWLLPLGVLYRSHVYVKL